MSATLLSAAMASDNSFWALPGASLQPLSAFAAVEAWNQDATLLVSTLDVTLLHTS